MQGNEIKANNDETINFESARDGALDIALSTRDRLQDALNSGKHGISNSLPSGPPLTIRELLYSNISDTRTIAIDHNTSRYMVLYKWHALATVRLENVLVNMEKLGDVVIRLSREKLDLYVLTVAEIVNGLANYSKEVIVSAYEDNKQHCHITLSKCPPDVLNRVIRRTVLDCSVSEWIVTGETGTIFTTFRGDKFKQVMEYADVTLSTNTNITVAHMGRVNAAILYNRYTNCHNKELQLANIFCANVRECNTYSSISRRSPVKRMSIRNQVSTLIAAALDGEADSLHTHESKLMVGVDI